MIQIRIEGHVPDAIIRKFHSFFEKCGRQINRAWRKIQRGDNVYSLKLDYRYRALRLKPDLYVLCHHSTYDKILDRIRR